LDLSNLVKGRHPKDAVVFKEFQTMAPEKPAAPALPAAGAEEEAYLASFPLSHGLTTAEANELLLKWGKNELPDKKKSKFMLFAENLWQPMPIILWVAAIVEFAISNPIDGAILCGINLANATLSFYEASKAGDAVEALKHSLKPTSICKRDGVWDHHFDATKLVPGDLIELIVGAAVPADCILNQGEVECDESAMTGESLPVCLTERMMAKMGGTVARGETEATVVYTGKNTFFGKTAAMLGGDKGRSSMQNLLLKIMIILVSISIVLCGICLIWLLVRPLTAREMQDNVQVGDRVHQASASSSWCWWRRCQWPSRSCVSRR